MTDNIAEDRCYTNEAFDSSRKFLDEHQKCHRHTEAVSECYQCNWRYFRDHSTHVISRAVARVAELEAENRKLRECADAMADAIEKHFKPEDQVILYRATFPREEDKHG